MNPTLSFQTWHFRQMFLHEPQQAMVRLAHLCKQESFSGKQTFQNIVPQVDGIDYDMESEALKFRNTPFLEYDTKRIGYKKRAHIWAFPIATEDLHATLDGYTALTARLAADSFRRFRDRVVAVRAADATRPIATKGTTNVTQEDVPESGLRAVVDTTKAQTEFKNLDLDTLDHAMLYFYNEEIGDGMHLGYTPHCFASPTQIQALLKEDKIINSDYAAIKALVNGTVGSYYGMQFRKTKISQTVGNADSRYFNNTNTVKTVATAGYNKITAGSTAERVLFCIPAKAFACGPIPRAGYFNVSQNPDKTGAIQFVEKDAVGVQSLQRQYQLIAYCKAATSKGAEIRKAPVQNSSYHGATKNDATQGWDYSASQS